MSVISDLIPVESDSDFVTRVYLILIIWTVMVIGAGILLVLIAL